MKFLREAYFFKLLKEGGKHSRGYENLKPSAGNSEKSLVKAAAKKSQLCYVRMFNCKLKF